MDTQSPIFINGIVLTPGGLADDLTVVVERGRISSIIPYTELPKRRACIYDLDGKLLLPGFIDTQVNGGGGVLFNDNPSVAGIEVITQAHRQFGTTGCLPTLISDEIEIVNEALKAGKEAIEQGVPGVLGIHIEGPFLNPLRRGVHDITKLKKLTCAMIERLQPLPNGKTLITLAPEVVPPNAISTLKKKGFIVCIGHTNANHAQTVDALDQGASGFTHLFNAMSQLNAREPGVVGAALDDKDSWCGIIVDGHHVDPASLRIALKCKAIEKIMLVTDAMSCVGSNQTEFKLLDKSVRVLDGVCRDQDGTLAGSALGMSDAVLNLMQIANTELRTAVEIASKNPAAFLGVNRFTGSIEVGKQADFVIADSQLNVHMTWNSGRLLYDASAPT